MIPISVKSEYIYNCIFENIIKILKENMDIKKIPKYFMVDFEKGLQNAIKKNFKDVQVDGCFFHFSKLLWSKAEEFFYAKGKSLKKLKF